MILDVKYPFHYRYDFISNRVYTTKGPAFPSTHLVYILVSALQKHRLLLSPSHHLYLHHVPFHLGPRDQPICEGSIHLLRPAHLCEETPITLEGRQITAPKDPAL